MRNQANFSFSRTASLACLLLMMMCGSAISAQTNLEAAGPGSNAKPEELVGSPETLRSYLQIQEQLHNMQQSIEHNRHEAELAATRTAELQQARMVLIEKSLTAQRLEELKDMQRSNRLVLIASEVFAGVAFLVLVLAAFLQWSAMNRLAIVAAALPTAPALGMGETQLLGAGAVEQSTTRFIGTIDRLEKRIHEMEHALQLPPPPANGVHANGDAKPMVTLPGDEATAALSPQPLVSEKLSGTGLLLGKGETLLKLDQLEGAIGCFDEVLAVDAANTEALVKKGIALERLQRLDEAVACYDRAIATDRSMTMAYLYKGGVFNRMERYSEALECYEKALRTQEKGPAANVIFE